MKLVKSFAILGIASTFLFSCKDAAGKPTVLNSADSNTALTTAAVIKKPETTSFKIDGMTCAIGCAKTIETKLAKMNGVQKASVDFDKKQATVEFDAAVLTPRQLIQAVESTGDGKTYKVSNVRSSRKA